MPEVVQTSGMDCGPAALKALLAGYGIAAGYGALREAANTDVDGTSIDTLEELAVAFGLDASQTVAPVEQVLLPEAHNLPAIAVVRLPSAVLHFLVLWRRVGPWVQVMDPAVGRRWMRASALRALLYHHDVRVPRDAWAAHARTDEFERPLRRELRDLGLSRAGADRLLVRARRTDLGPADLEAATRFVGDLRRAVRLPAREVRGLLERLLDAPHLLPHAFYAVRAVDADEVELHGAVVLRVRGRVPRAAASQAVAAVVDGRADAVSLAPLGAMVLQDGVAAPLGAVGLAGISAAATVLQALVFRALVDLTGDFATVRHRLAGVATLAGLAAVHAIVDRAWDLSLAGIGRRLELRLRVALHLKLPRLQDVYFRTRLVSDLADRAHALSRIAALPTLVGRTARHALELGLVVLAIGLLDPWVLPVAAVGAAALVAVPLLAVPALAERDRVERDQWGALYRWFLDALRGVWAVRAHTADETMRLEHERGLVAWGEAVRRTVWTAVGADLLSAAAGVAVAVAVLGLHTAHVGWTGAALLLVWWSLQLPALGERLGAAWRAYPEARNVALRLLEPLTGPESPDDAAALAPGAEGVAIELRGVGVRLGGRQALDGVDLRLARGEHVAVVGRSGGGKSLLVATLLGFHRATGEILVDGRPLHAPSLRAVTRWVDPSVQLWSGSVLANLRYAAASLDDVDLDEVLAASDLLDLVGTLPEGLQTAVGDDGGRLSGGEGQRVRLGRALVQGAARLVVLDEAFRGLDRHHRGRLLERVRARSEGTTLLCVTHDLEHALTFDRVVVVDGGRVIEDGAPTELAARTDSTFAALLAAEGRVLDRQRVAFGAARVDRAGLREGA